MEQTVLRVNGKECRVTAAPDTPLVYVLRNDLGLKSVKLGCGSEQCGACHVIVDGEAVPCCTEPVSAFQGKDITTLEAIAGDGSLAPLQEVFLQHNAAQCGYCLSGILMTVKALLDRDPHAGETAVRAALAGNLCRCGAHPRILRAIGSLIEGGYA